MVSPFISLKNAVFFIIITCLVPVLFTFYVQGVLKLNNSGTKRLMRRNSTFFPLRVFISFEWFWVSIISINFHGVCNGDELCSLRFRNWIFMYYLHRCQASASVPCPSLLVSGFSPQQSRLEPWPINVVFMVPKMALGLVFSEYVDFLQSVSSNKCCYS